MQKVLDVTAYTFDDLLRAGDGETDHVDHDIRLEIADALPEDALCIFLFPVRTHLLNRTPRAMCLIRITLGARDIDHFVPCRYKSRHKVGTYMAASTNNHYTHTAAPFYC
jgi:hypothetical protein